MTDCITGLLPTTSLSARPNPRSTMVFIPGGPFLMGSDQDSGAERPVHEVHISPYFCSRHAITRVEFGSFLSDLRDRLGKIAKAIGLTTEQAEELLQLQPSCTNTPEAEGNRPAVGLSWHDAQAYAVWLAWSTNEPFRLPTEAEWEKAARGGLHQRDYPWGNESAEAMGANFGYLMAFGEDWTVPVEHSPQNGFGLHVGGNCWEWVADWYDADYYRYSPSQDPGGPEHGEFRVRRGGAYNNRQAFRLRVASRNRLRPDQRFPNMGFRLVRDVVPGEVLAENLARAADASVSRRSVRKPASLLEWDRAISQRLQLVSSFSDRVEAVLDVLRPNMEMDRGGVVVEQAADGQVTLRMVGTCSSCPKSALTFADLADTLKRHIREIASIQRIGQ